MVRRNEGKMEGSPRQFENFCMLICMAFIEVEAFGGKHSKGNTWRITWVERGERVNGGWLVKDSFSHFFSLFNFK